MNPFLGPALEAGGGNDEGSFYFGKNVSDDVYLQQLAGRVGPI